MSQLDALGASGGLALIAGAPVELFHELDARWQIGRTLYELDAPAAAQEDRARASACFTDALAAFEAMRAGPDAERARAALKY